MQCTTLYTGKQDTFTWSKTDNFHMDHLHTCIGALHAIGTEPGCWPVVAPGFSLITQEDTTHHLHGMAFRRSSHTMPSRCEASHNIPREIPGDRHQSGGSVLTHGPISNRGITPRYQSKEAPSDVVGSHTTSRCTDWHSPHYYCNTADMQSAKCTDPAADISFTIEKYTATEGGQHDITLKEGTMGQHHEGVAHHCLQLETP